MSDPIKKVPQLDQMLTRIADAATVRCKIASRRLPEAAQATRIRAAAARFSSELLDVASELAPTKESDTQFTSPKGGSDST